MGWNCKHCGTYNEETDAECIVCGASRSTAEYKEPTPTVTKPSTSTPSRPTTTPRTTTVPRTTSTPRTSTTVSPSRVRRSRYVGTEAKKRIAKIIAFCLIGLSFIAGQVLLYLFFCTRDTVFALTALVEKSGNVDFNTTAFIASMTVVGAIAGILIYCDISYLVGRRKYAYVWLITLPYCITMVLIPSIIACLAFVFGVVFAIVKKYGAIKPLTIIYIVLMAASIIVFPSVAAGVSKDAPESIQYENATYERAEDGKYYVTEYSGDNDLLVIPTIIKDKYQVGGVAEDYKESKDFYSFELNFEHATENNEILQVIAFNLKTDEKFPIPQREDYTFYGWWSTNNRNTGKQVIDKDGKIVGSNIAKEQVVHAMWYGTDYTFIASSRDFYISNYGKYVLTNDIEMTGNYTPVGGLSGMETQSSRRAFNGVFDGNFHTIKYSISGSRRYNGLFSWVGPQGTVKNLGVNVNIKVEFKPTSTDYFAFAGGIAAINDGKIIDCWSEGSIYLKSATSVAESGGIAGASGTDNMRTGEIRGCYNLATIETVADDAYAGGILGSAQNNGHIVSYCYNRGTIKATGVNSNNTAAGGIISHGRTYAKHCFNAGAIMTDYSDKQSIGGILGFTRNTSSHNSFPTDCVWLKAKNCQAKWGIGTYSNDTSGGNNNGVTVVDRESDQALKILNGDTKEFVLHDGQIRLSWELL